MPTVRVEDLQDIVLDPLVEGSSTGLKGVLGVPEGDGPWPAVVLVHELFGLDEEMRKQIAHVASLGYLALMPDLFTNGGMGRCLISTMKSLPTGKGRAFADIETARRFLLARPDANGAVGVLGFCMGGGFALMTSASGFDAASANYGQLPKDLDVFEHACPIVGSYGAKDVTLKGAAERLESALEERGVPHDVKEYLEAGHVFMNEKLNGWPWLRPIVRVINFGPHPESAADAWNRIDAFFTRYLKQK